MKKEKIHNIKSTGFKTPDTYFEAFDDKILQRITDQTIINGIETSGFKTPENYFDSIENNVLSKLKSENKTPVISIFRKKQFYYIAGIAASLLLLFAVFISQPQTEELSIDLVENYLINSDLSTYELAELLIDTDILEDNFTITETDYTEENLEDYLLENADIESILE